MLGFNWQLDKNGLHEWWVMYLGEVLLGVIYPSGRVIFQGSTNNNGLVPVYDAIGPLPEPMYYNHEDLWQATQYANDCVRHLGIEFKLDDNIKVRAFSWAGPCVTVILKGKSVFVVEVKNGNEYTLIHHAEYK